MHNGAVAAAQVESQISSGDAAGSPEAAERWMRVLFLSANVRKAVKTHRFQHEWERPMCQASVSFRFVEMRGADCSQPLRVRMLRFVEMTRRVCVASRLRRVCVA